MSENSDFNVDIWMFDECEDEEVMASMIMMKNSEDLNFLQYIAVYPDYPAINIHAIYRTIGFRTLVSQIEISILELRRRSEFLHRIDYRRIVCGIDDHYLTTTLEIVDNRVEFTVLLEIVGDQSHLSCGVHEEDILIPILDRYDENSFSLIARGIYEMLSSLLRRSKLRKYLGQRLSLVANEAYNILNGRMFVINSPVIHALTLANVFSKELVKGLPFVSIHQLITNLNSRGKKALDYCYHLGSLVEILQLYAENGTPDFFTELCDGLSGQGGDQEFYSLIGQLGGLSNGEDMLDIMASNIGGFGFGKIKDMVVNWVRFYLGLIAGVKETERFPIGADQHIMRCFSIVSNLDYNLLEKVVLFNLSILSHVNDSTLDGLVMESLSNVTDQTSVLFVLLITISDRLTSRFVKGKLNSSITLAHLGNRINGNPVIYLLFESNFSIQIFQCLKPLDFHTLMTTIPERRIMQCGMDLTEISTPLMTQVIEMSNRSRLDSNVELMQAIVGADTDDDALATALGYSKHSESGHAYRPKQPLLEAILEKTGNLTRKSNIFMETICRSKLEMLRICCKVYEKNKLQLQFLEVLSAQDSEGRNSLLYAHEHGPQYVQAIKDVFTDSVDGAIFNKALQLELADIYLPMWMENVRQHRYEQLLRSLFEKHSTNPPALTFMIDRQHHLVTDFVRLVLNPKNTTRILKFMKQNWDREISQNTYLKRLVSWIDSSNAPDGFYPSFNRPYVIIFWTTRGRPGAPEEAESLIIAFESIDLSVDAQDTMNFSKEQALAILRDDDRIKAPDGLIVIMMSHGAAGYINDNSGERIKLEEIEEAMCMPSRDGIPKILITQCCQRYARQQPRNPASIPENSLHLYAKRYDLSVDDTSDPVERSSYQPNHPDFCVFMSCHPGQYSIRGYFIRLLANEIVQVGQGASLDVVFQNVTDIMKNEEKRIAISKKSYKQIPFINNLLRKCFQLKQSWLDKLIRDDTLNLPRNIYPIISSPAVIILHSADRRPGAETEYKTLKSAFQSIGLNPLSLTSKEDLIGALKDGAINKQNLIVIVLAHSRGDDTFTDSVGAVVSINHLMKDVTNVKRDGPIVFITHLHICLEEIDDQSSTSDCNLRDDVFHIKSTVTYQSPNHAPSCSGCQFIPLLCDELLQRGNLCDLRQMLDNIKHSIETHRQTLDTSTLVPNLAALDLANLPAASSDHVQKFRPALAASASLAQMYDPAAIENMNIKFGISQDLMEEYLRVAMKAFTGTESRSVAPDRGALASYQDVFSGMSRLQREMSHGSLENLSSSSMNSYLKLREAVLTNPKLREFSQKQIGNSEFESATLEYSSPEKFDVMNKALSDWSSAQQSQMIDIYQTVECAVDNMKTRPATARELRRFFITPPLVDALNNHDQQKSDDSYTEAKKFSLVNTGAEQRCNKPASHPLSTNQDEAANLPVAAAHQSEQSLPPDSLLPIIPGSQHKQFRATGPDENHPLVQVPTLATSPEDEAQLDCQPDADANMMKPILTSHGNKIDQKSPGLGAALKTTKYDTDGGKSMKNCTRSFKLQYQSIFSNYI